MSKILGAVKARFSKLNQSLKDTIKRTVDDYKAAASDTAENIKSRPARSLLNTAAFCGAIYLYKTVPEEQNFHASLVEASNDLLLVGDAIRNPVPDNHVQKIMQYTTKGMLRYRHFGVFSVVYFSDYDRDERTYLSQCKYTNPTWSELPSRVVDIGCMGKWWKLRWVMTDFDVNFEEHSKEFNHYYEELWDHIRTFFGYTYFNNLIAQPLKTQLYVATAADDKV
ncbi:mitochondrial import inner membrane translocase subunit Tim29-like [Ciona intestinalis]